MRGRPNVMLDARPLLRLVSTEQINLIDHDQRTQRAFYRARKTGEVTVQAADLLAIRLLNMHPCEIWGLDTWTPTQ